MLIADQGRSRYWALPEVVMRLNRFSPETGNFRAESEGSPLKLIWTRTTEGR